MTFRLKQEISETLRRPWRLWNIASISKWKRRLRLKTIKSMVNDEWTKVEQGSSALEHRRYSSYEAYVEVQKSKLEFLDLEAHEARFREALAKRLRDKDFVSRRARVLCLGARLGGEVHAFLDFGCFAVGIDLNPGDQNPVVLPGDFHALVFADDSVDVIYSNSLDHCLDLAQVCQEVRRVLTPEGVFIVEADPGTEDCDAVAPDTWASLSWKSVDDFQEALIQLGFTLVERKSFEYPRAGEQLVLRPVELD